MQENALLQHIYRTERDTRKFRLLALAAATAVLYMRREDVLLWPIVGLIVGYLFYTFILYSRALRRLPANYLVLGMASVDTVTVALTLHFLGGVESPLFLLLPGVVMYYAIYLGYLSAIFTAVAASFAYVGVAILEGYAIYAGTTIAVQVPLLFVLAMMSGYLSQRRFEERKEKEELQEFIRLESRAKAVLEAARGLIGATDLDQELKEVVQKASEMIGLPFCVAALRSEDGKALVGMAGNFLPKELGVEGFSDLSSPWEAAPALENGMPWVAPTRANPLPLWAQWRGVGHILGIPLIGQAEVVGILYLFGEGIDYSFTERELRIVRGFGEAVGSTIAAALAAERAKGRIIHVMGELEEAIDKMERLRETGRPRELVVGDLLVDGAKERVFCSGREISLSPTEFGVLYQLAESAGTPLSQETLKRRVWGDAYHGESNVVDLTIHRLRRKIEENPSQPRRVVTVRRAGYMLVARQEKKVG